MPTPSYIIQELVKLQTHANAGFAVALHVEYTTPTFLFQDYPQDWINLYSEKGFLMSDPTVKWAFDNQGTMPWSAHADQDDAGIFKLAATYGLNFGLTCGVAGDTTLSIGNFARSDREFNAEETADLLRVTQDLHAQSADLKPFSGADLDEFERLKIHLSQPSA